MLERYSPDQLFTAEQVDAAIQHEWARSEKVCAVLSALIAKSLVVPRGENSNPVRMNPFTAANGIAYEMLLYSLPAHGIQRQTVEIGHSQGLEHFIVTHHTFLDSLVGDGCGAKLVKRNSFTMDFQNGLFDAHISVRRTSTMQSPDEETNETLLWDELFQLLQTNLTAQA